MNEVTSAKEREVWFRAKSECVPHVIALHNDNSACLMIAELHPAQANNLQPARPVSEPLTILSARFGATSGRIGLPYGPSEVVVTRLGDALGRDEGLDFTGTGAAQNFRRVPVVRNPILHDVEEDIEIEQDFHRCLSSRCRRWSASTSHSAGTNPVRARTSGWMETGPTVLRPWVKRPTSSATVIPCSPAKDWSESTSSEAISRFNVALGISVSELKMAVPSPRGKFACFQIMAGEQLVEPPPVLLPDNGISRVRRPNVSSESRVFTFSVHP